MLIKLDRCWQIGTQKVPPSKNIKRNWSDPTIADPIRPFPWRLKTSMWCDDIWQFSNQVIVFLYTLIQIQSPDEKNDLQQPHHMIASTFDPDNQIQRDRICCVSLALQLLSWSCVLHFHVMLSQLSDFRSPFSRSTGSRVGSSASSRPWLCYVCTCIYIYIYREREREIYVYTHIHIYIFTCI